MPVCFRATVSVMVLLFVALSAAVAEIVRDDVASRAAVTGVIVLLLVVTLDVL